MFERLVKFIARHLAVPILQWLRKPVLARFIHRISFALKLQPSPPKEAVPETRVWANRIGNRNGQYKEIYAPAEFRLESPQSIEPKVHWHFSKQLTLHANPAFLASIPNGSVHGAYGSIVSGDGVVLGDLSLEWFFKHDQHSLLFKFKLPQPQVLNGTSVSIATASGWNYFHWLLDVLPRFGILEKSGVDLTSIDWFIINGGGSPFQKQSLDRLGVPEAKRIEVGRKKHLKAERLLVPSLPGIPSQTPPWAVSYLRERFTPDPDQGNLPKRIYISRARSKYRMFSNEKEVGSLLSGLGFTEVFCEELSFREQVNLFAAAEWIVAPHGAGLSNLVFCRPGATVIEIFSPNYVNGCFWVLANWAGARYFYLLGEGDRPPEFHDPHRVEDDIAVNISDLKQTFQLAGLI